MARTDLKMGKGKLAAQVAHASLAAAEESMRRHDEWYRRMEGAGTGEGRREGR